MASEAFAVADIEAVYIAGEEVEYNSTTLQKWVRVRVVETHHRNTKVRLSCHQGTWTKLAGGLIRKLQSDGDVTMAMAPQGRLLSKQGSGGSSPAQRSNAGAQTRIPVATPARVPKRGEFALATRAEQQAHAKILPEIEPPGVMIELVRVFRQKPPPAARASAGASAVVRSSFSGCGLALYAGRDKKKQLARQRSEAASTASMKSELDRAQEKQRRRAQRIAPDTVRRHGAPVTGRGSKADVKKTVEKNTASPGHRFRDKQRMQRDSRDSGARTQRPEKGKGAPEARQDREALCTSRIPVVGDRVRDKDGLSSEAPDWEMPAGEVATVTAVDQDGDFMLRNPQGLVSGWQYRETYVYTEGRTKGKTKKEPYDVTALFSDSDNDDRKQSKAQKRLHSVAESANSKRMRTSGMTPAFPESPDDLQPQAKKAKAKSKSQAKPKQAPPPAAVAAAAVVVPPVAAPVAVAPAAPAGPAPLDKQGKQELQNNIDLLGDDYLETVLRFLESDIAGDDDEINLDLDNLPPDRQQQLVRVVDEELTKQRARQEAHARGERTPPESPMFDIGKDILTPLQSHQPAPSTFGAPLSPLHLEAATKSVLLPTATPTPFPTPSECGEEEATAQRQHIAAAATAACAASPAGSAGSSVAKLMQDTISRQVRKAVKATPELTESKTPRQHGTAASPKNGASSADSPKTRAPDSMLASIDEDELAFLANDEAVENAADAQRVRVAEKERATSATGISGISGETA